jgi:hypothetical protein
MPESSHAEWRKSVVRARTNLIFPASVAGIAVSGWSGHIREALLACILGPPAIAAGRVLAKWIERLEPPTQ